MKYKIIILLLIVAAMAASWFIYDMLYGDVAQIKGTIRGCASAANERDVPLFMSFISVDYRDDIRDLIPSSPSRQATSSATRQRVCRGDRRGDWPGHRPFRRQGESRRIGIVRSPTVRPGPAGHD